MPGGNYSNKIPFTDPSRTVGFVIFWFKNGKSNDIQLSIIYQLGARTQWIIDAVLKKGELYPKYDLLYNGLHPSPHVAHKKTKQIMKNVNVNEPVESWKEQRSSVCRLKGVKNVCYLPHLPIDWSTECHEEGSDHIIAPIKFDMGQGYYRRITC